MNTVALLSFIMCTSSNKITNMCNHSSEFINTEIVYKCFQTKNAHGKPWSMPMLTCHWQCISQINKNVLTLGIPKMTNFYSNHEYRSIYTVWITVYCRVHFHKILPESEQIHTLLFHQNWWILFTGWHIVTHNTQCK